MVPQLTPGPDPALRYPRRRPSRSICVPREILSQAWAPLQSVTHAPPCATCSRLTPLSYAAHPFRGFFPYSVLPAARSHLHPVSFHLTGYVAPLGFRTPSTRCSPRSLPGLFHPGPAPGVFPSRLCSPRNAVRPLERRSPPAIQMQRSAASSPQGFSRPGDPARKVWGLAKTRAGCPLGVLPLRGFLYAAPGENRTVTLNPHTLSRLGRLLALPPAPQGTQRCERSRSLSRPAYLLEVSHLVGCLGSLDAPQCWDYRLPSEIGTRRRSPHLLFAPPSSILP
jgi:hypothetical protein